MASVQDYRDGQYRVVVRRTGFNVRSKIFGTRGEAERWGRAIEAEMDQRVYLEPAGALKATVASVLERFRDEVAPLRKGAHWEQVRLNMILRTAEFPKRRLDQLSTADLRDWRDARLLSVSGSSVNREIRLLSSVFSHAMKEWSLPLRENPFAQVKRPKENKARNRRWSDQDLAKLLAAAKHDPDVDPVTGKDYVGWCALLSIETAMRLGEVALPRVEDYHRDSRYLHLVDTKNGESRDVPLSRRALEILDKMVARRKPGQRILPCSAESLGVYFRAARDAAGVGDLRYHDTRHEAATRISKKVSNVLELSAITGHKTLQCLKRYYNPTATELASRLD